MNILLRTLFASAGLAATLAVAADQPPLIDAEVRKVDGAAGKITLKHGDITNLDMPAMTMVFQVKDPATLGAFKAGDPVRFRAEKVNGAYVASDIELRR